MLQNGVMRSTAQPLNFYLLEAWTFFYYFSILSNVALFIHRYFVLCWQVPMNLLRHYIMLLLAALIVGGHVYLIDYAGGPTYPPMVNKFGTLFYIQYKFLTLAPTG
jgi:uncharacterized membrane protein